MVLKVTALPFLAWRIVSVPESPTDSIRYSPFGRRFFPTIKSNGISALILTVKGAAMVVASDEAPKMMATVTLIISFFIFLLGLGGRTNWMKPGRGWVY